MNTILHRPLGLGTAKSFHLFFAALSALFLLGASHAIGGGGTNYDWDGGGSDNNWNTANNWNPNGTPTFDNQANLRFGGNTRASPVNNLPGTTSLRRIQFLSGASSFNLTGNAVNIVNNDGIQNSSTNLQTVSLSDIGLGAANFALAATSGELLINSVLSGTNGFEVSGSRVTLAGTNLHSGANTVSSGAALRITNGAALGTIAAGTIVSSGAALELQGGITTLAEALAIDGAGISSGGALRNISGNNTYAGGITINSDTTRINSDAGLLTLDVASGNAITGSNDDLTFGGAGNISVLDVIATGNGTLTKDGAGILTLGAANTYTGITTISAGTLRVAANAPSGSSGALGNASSDVVLGAAGGNVDASLLISGAFTVGRIVRVPTSNNTDAGTRVLTLGGDTADNSVFSGNIILGTNSQAGRGVTLTAASGGQVTFSGVIQNPTAMDATSYTVTKSGLGAVVLSNANTYTGSTSITAGTLFANNTTGSATGTGAVSVGASGKLGGTGTITPTGANGINVTGVLTPGGSVGTGTLTLSMGGTTGTVTMNSGAGFELLLGASGLNISSFGTSDMLTIAGAAANDFSFSGNNVNFLNSGLIGFYKLFNTDLANANPATDTWNNLNYDLSTGVVSSGLTYSNLAGGYTGNFIVGTATNGGDLGDIYFQVVPEPRAALLGTLGALLLLRRRR